MNWLKAIRRLFSPRVTAPPAGQAAQATGPRRSPVVVARVDKRPFWQIRNWHRNGNTLTGYYRTPLGSFAGKVVLQAGRPAFFIKNAPKALLKGPHGMCFQERPGGWYSVHFSKTSKEVDAGIVSVEMLLFEALSKR